ncbi:MAG: hypothetical protein JJE22_14320 [Bacteroidia bacterium]|nr:hypothetical protein [Bacteroidia bacterium]
MYGIRKTIFTICLLLVVFFSNAQRDTMIMLQDTTIDYTADCFTIFFKRATKLPSLDRTILVTKAGKKVTMASFLKTETSADLKYGLIDLDMDGKKELVIYNFSGGAHCCDEFYFFKNIGTNKYQYAAKTFGGNVCVTGDNEFVFDFNEHFGYFFTCYACAYDESDIMTNPIHNIFLKYDKGKLSVVPGDDELRNQINDYLAILSEEPYEKLNNDLDQDNGLRKEFAFHFAVFYYSFGKNMEETKRLFDKYYKFPDAKKVWTEFVKRLSDVKNDNDF